MTSAGVNWADPRDNYASDAVVPSGLSVTDDYRTVYRTTGRMVRGFKKNLGANTLRLPINPASVGTTWWKSYRATIDAATADGDKVIVSYWEADSSKDGLVDDTAAWKTMWNTVVREYKHNPRVYFEPMNEPHGYTLDQWVSVTSGWLAQHKDVPRGRVVISGTGYNDNVTGVGAAPELRGTLLSLHFYGFWASYTQQADWTADLEARIGKYAGRTIIDEAGSPMTIGLNYGAWNGNVYTSYLAAVANTARSKGMGLVYWPGLRFGDAYSIESLDSEGNMVDNSATGVALLRWGYGFGKTAARQRPAARASRRGPARSGLGPLRRRARLQHGQRHPTRPLGLQRRRQPDLELERGQATHRLRQQVHDRGRHRSHGGGPRGHRRLHRRGGTAVERERGPLRDQRREPGALPGRGRSGHRQRHGGRRLVLQRKQQPAVGQKLMPAPVPRDH